MLSEMKKFSIGLVCKNKDLSSNFIDVYPIELITEVDGDLEEDEKILNIAKSKSINAEWLPINTNRVTPPDVRKNETVQIYQYGETDKYYWVDLFSELDFISLPTCSSYSFISGFFGHLSVLHNL